MTRSRTFIGKAARVRAARVMTACFALTALAVLAAPATAQDTYPNKPITMVVPFAAGGASDVIARLIAEQMGQTIGQRFVIENVVGAGGSTAMTRAARATADGYTIIIGNSGTATAVYALYPDLKFTPDDFAPIGIVAKTSPVIALKKDLPAKTLKAFIDYAKQNPGKATLGHAGVGSSNYLICKAFVQAAGIEVTLVSYRGGGPALNDLLAGQIDGVCDNAASVAPSIQGGLTNGVAVGMPNRLRSLPDVPTTIEAGLPEFQLQGWNGLFAPKGTAQPVIDKLNAALRKGVASDAYHKRLDDLGALPPNGEEMSAAYLKQFVPAEIEKFRTLLAEKK
jgi:tripartite-type tricarboxylate transporter receptor subunit TctC